MTNKDFIAGAATGYALSNANPRRIFGFVLNLWAGVILVVLALSALAASLIWAWVNGAWPFA